MSTPNFSFVAAMLLFAILIVGCLQNDMATSGIHVSVEATYDQSFASQDERSAVAYSEGTPADGLILMMTVEAVPGEEYLWSEGESCTPGFVNEDTGERQETDCSAIADKETYRVPAPPEGPEGETVLYPFDSEGELRLSVPGTLKVHIAGSQSTGDKLEGYRTGDPCGDKEGHHEERVDLVVQTASGGIEPVGADSRKEVVIRDSGTIDMAFFVTCLRTDLD